MWAWKLGYKKFLLFISFSFGSNGLRCATMLLFGTVDTQLIIHGNVSKRREWARARKTYDIIVVCPRKRWRGTNSLMPTYTRDRHENINLTRIAHVADALHSFTSILLRVYYGQHTINTTTGASATQSNSERASAVMFKVYGDLLKDIQFGSWTWICNNEKCMNVISVCCARPRDLFVGFRYVVQASFLRGRFYAAELAFI